MAQPLFHGPRSKIRRARAHILALESLEADFIINPPFDAVSEPHPTKQDHWRLVARNCLPLSEDIPLILGDAIHNLRTSLDLLACDLVRANGGSDKGVYFPFCEKGGDLEEMIQRRHLDKRCAPDVVDIVRSLKPYKGGNDALRAIHDLDVSDKHKLLIPTLTAMLHPSLEIDFVNQVMITRPIEECEAALRDGLVIIDDIPNSTPLAAFADRRNVTALVFESGQPLAGETVVPVLHDLAKLADGIVETFAAHVLRGNP